MSNSTPRRDFLAATSAAFTTQIFTGNLRGANDKVTAGFIGMGRMGNSNLTHAMRQENLNVAAVCDIYEPNLTKAMEIAKGQAKAVRDFREILADKSIDVVCISTPDHWHAYMAVEACKAGKDVYVEKPIGVTIDEGKKMVEAARKYKRVVQAGTMQRSAEHFQKAAEIVKSGLLGQIAFVRTWNYGLAPQEGIGNPPDGDPPAELNWDMWQGPAAKRAYNKNRFGVDPKAFSHFRWFWDYAGGMMTDWGVHWLDIVQMAFNEQMPQAAVALGGKYWLKDNRETPDTLQVTYEYPGFICTYENRNSSSISMFEKGGGILFQGTKATMFLDRSLYRIVPERNSTVEAVEVKATSSGNARHWANFLECVRTRQKPNSDIENCHKSTTTCHLGNIAYRSRQRVDWDTQKETIVQPELRKYMAREYRKPWKLTV
ncbi:MAG: Gfo/Idh/MocA family oxidoreductase [Acidobacteria bacterium]|nr:Gfo/Idh/MocA family oxidoreductase [Acidobacteriota bacterium]